MTNKQKAAVGAVLAAAATIGVLVVNPPAPKPIERLEMFQINVPRSEYHRYNWYVQATGNGGLSWFNINCSNMDSNGIVTITVNKSVACLLYRVCGEPKG